MMVVLVEWGLRQQGGGSEPLIRVEHKGGTWWATNPEYGRVVFPREAGPTLPPIWVPAAKTDNELRIVVLGESAAEGFPIPDFNLARVLETLLARRTPGVQVRVVSLAMTGINSHQIRRLGMAAARHLEPDIVVLYAGNNEVIGPNGPAAVLSNFHRSLRLMRLQDALREWRLARLVDRALRRWHRRVSDPEVWRGLDEFDGIEIAFDDPRLPAMYRHFEDNMTRLVRGLTGRGIRVVVCTMGVNLNDWPPLRSEPEAGPVLAAAPPSPEAVRSAEAAYHRAVDLAQAGEIEAAWTWYRRACDLDLIRFRADTRINDLLRGLGGASRKGRVVLVDVDRALHEEDPGGGEDRRWFYEHVHLTLAGRIAVAGWIADAVADAGWVAASRHGKDESETLVDSLVFTPRDEFLALTAIREFYRWPLFEGQWRSGERVAGLEAEIQRLQADWAAWDSERVRHEWDASRSWRPQDPLRDASVGGHLLALGDAAGALEVLEAALDANPMLRHARADAARAGLRLGDLDRAFQHLEAGLAQSPADPALLAARGEWAVVAQRWDEAESYLSEAHRLRPRDLRVVIQLARTVETLGDASRAESLYRYGLDLSPDSPHFLNNLALLLLSRPESHDEALALATRATESAPTSPAVWRTLARVLERRGDAAAARHAALQADTIEQTRSKPPACESRPSGL